jgi:hypothetical protein
LAAVIVTVALAAGVLAGCGSSHRRAVPPPSPPPPTTPAATSATTRPDTGPYEWTRAASPVLAVGGGASSTLAAVVAPSGGRPWTVAGTRLGADGSSTATVWTSADGAAWTAQAMTGPQVDSEASAAATWRTATVVVGSIGRSPNRRAAAWISAAPGAAFVEVAADQPAANNLLTGDAAMTTVAGGPLGLFAAGVVGGHVALWYSSNGQRWAQLTAAERVIGGATDPHITTLLAAPDGAYAGGWERNGSAVAAALWTSGDGVNWHPVLSAQTAFAGPGDRAITGLASLGTLGAGLVAVGATRTGPHWSPAAWISPNGASWSQPSSAFGLGAGPLPDGSDGGVAALTAVPTGPRSATLVATGGAPTAARLWRSTDGVHWAALALPAAAAASAYWRASLVAVAGSTTVVADGDLGQPHLLVQRGASWAEPSTNPATFGTVQAVARPVGLAYAGGTLTLAVNVDQSGQALGPGAAAVDLLTSTDAITWAPAATGGVFAGATVTGLTARAGGLVAVGRRRQGRTDQAVAWTRLAGGAWRPPTALDPGPVGGSDVATGVCASASLVAVVGGLQPTRGGPVPRAWLSGDGIHWTTATVAADPRPTASAEMAGCAPATPGAEATTAPSRPTITAGGPAGAPVFDAFGTSAVTGAGPVPAYWTSASGRAWAAQTSSPFGPGFPFPADAVARRVPAWLAAAAGAPGGFPSSAAGLWRSADSGASWQRLDTSGVPWQGSQPAQIDRVAWFGTVPVVAGQVDGGLAVWTGLPNS